MQTCNPVRSTPHVGDCQSWIQRGFNTAAVFAATFLMGFAGPANVQADEPAELFLQQLRAAEYFDVALDYLAHLEDYPGVPAELKTSVDLEKAQVYLEAAGAARVADERDGYFAEGEAALQNFIANSPSHPRLSEARMMLGTRQLIRAMVLMQNPRMNDEIRAKAREEYLKAAKTFDTSIESLREALKAMPTGVIDPEKNPGLQARREQYRGEYMQAQLQAGQSRRLAAGTYKDPAKEGKPLLEEALKRLVAFSEKYSSFPPGAKATLYRGQVQQVLGQNKEALESYQRVQELIEDDRLRIPKIEAARGTIQLYLAEKPPKVKPAIERGQPWIDALRPNEKRAPEVQELRLALAKAYQMQAKASEKPAERKAAATSARQLLTAAKAVPGSHAEETLQMLAEMGVDTTVEAPKLERPRSLDEALAAARTMIESADQMGRAEDLLKQKLKEPDADKAAIQKELDNLSTDLVSNRENAAIILQQGLALVKPGDDVAQINQGRNFLAYVLFRLERFREAAAVGEFLAVTSPGDPLGLSGGVTALNAMQTLSQQASEGQREEILTGLSSIGSLLIEHWPNEPAVSAARGSLIAVALNQERWDDARKHLDNMPDDAPDKAYFLRVMGNLMWNRYLIRLQNDPEDATAADLLPDAEKDLITGLKPVTAKALTSRELDASLVLAKVLIRQGKENDALKVLENKNYGPLTHADKGDQDFQLKAYTTALQVIVGQMTAEKADIKALTKQSADIVAKMQKATAGKPDAQTQMANRFKALAVEIRDQMQGAPAGKKEALMTAFQTLMGALAAANDSPETQLMVGQSFAQIGEGAMPNDVGPAKGKAAEMLTNATEILKTVIPDIEDPEQKMKVQYQLGRAERLLGDYSGALKTLTEVVTFKQTMLTAQEEAALTYEQWGIQSAATPNRAAKAHALAIRGSRPDAKGKHQIWGWGTISQRTSKNPAFRESFFQARYHLALNRFLEGQAEKNDAKMRDGIKFTKELKVFYPDLGGKAWAPKFEALVQRIQTAVGDPPVGLE